MAIAAVAVTMVLMLLWFAIALLFRWRFQFSIRSLLVLTVAVAVPCSWLAVEMNQTRRERKLVETVYRNGCIMCYDKYFDSSGNVMSVSSSAPFCLQELQSVLFFEVTDVNIYDYATSGLTNVTDQDLKQLENFKHLQRLIISRTDFTDSHLEYLEGLKQVRWLYLYCPKVTNAGLKHLEGLRNLRILSLRSSKVTDAGVAELQKSLPNCRIEH